MSDKQEALRYKLGTGKFVYVREPNMQDDEIAAQKAGARASNQLHSTVALLKEYAKLIILGVGQDEESEPEVLTMAKKELLHEVFTPKEWRQIQVIVQSLMGGDDFLTLSSPEITTI